MRPKRAACCSRNRRRCARRASRTITFAAPKMACTSSRGLRRPHSADRKSTRLNSSHSQISYAVFCLKKKKDKYSIVSIEQEYVHAVFSYTPNLRDNHALSRPHSEITTLTRREFTPCYELII